MNKFRKILIQINENCLDINDNNLIFYKSLRTNKIYIDTSQTKPIN